ncbi:MAG: helix-turn-helix transcriptional regulator [Lacibacter sp.]
MATTTLKILREINDHTQEAIANVLGISQNTYSRLEKNPGSLSTEQAQKLAEFYNVSITDLLSESKPIVTFQHPKFDTANNAYVNHVENDNRQAANISEIASLKEEISYLRKQNDDMLKIISERK